jgi:hypothetical protein
MFSERGSLGCIMRTDSKVVKGMGMTWWYDMAMDETQDRGGRDWL